MSFYNYDAWSYNGSLKDYMKEHLLTESERLINSIYGEPELEMLHSRALRALEAVMADISEPPRSY